LDPWLELARIEGRLGAGTYGAAVTFTGTLRDFSDGANVRHMELEHYPGMTERMLERVCVDAERRHAVFHVDVVHRVGRLSPGDPIVLVAVWAEHRTAAFDACREIINYLKEQAPFWKRETLADGARWVTKNTLDPNLPQVDSA
jgi:molybdopterin synthase catalytic subunit